MKTGYYLTAYPKGKPYHTVGPFTSAPAARAEYHRLLATGEYDRIFINYHGKPSLFAEPVTL